MFEKQKMLAYTITGDGEKKFWNRVGYGSVNKDGSINITLYGLPVNGKITIRELIDKEQTEKAE